MTKAGRLSTPNPPGGLLGRHTPTKHHCWWFWPDEWDWKNHGFTRMDTDPCLSVSIRGSFLGESGLPGGHSPPYVHGSGLRRVYSPSER